MLKSKMHTGAIRLSSSLAQDNPSFHLGSPPVSVASPTDPVSVVSPTALTAGDILARPLLAAAKRSGAAWWPLAARGGAPIRRPVRQVYI